MTPDQKQYDLYCRIREERNYWRKRCELAEKIGFNMPSVFSSTTEERVEYFANEEAYNEFMSNNKEPK